MRPEVPAPVALVTGATGGLGREIARRLARDGYRLFLHGRDAVRLAALSAELREAGPSAPHVLVADLADPASVAAMCEEVESSIDRLDLLINNAGTGFEPVGTSPAAVGVRTFQVNYLAAYLIMHRLLPLMQGVEGSAIVNLASKGQSDLPEDLAQAGKAPAAIAYGRSKLALIMATRSLGEREPAGRPAVFAVHPGSMLDTGMTRSLLQRMPSWVGFVWRATRRLRPTVEAAAGFVVDVARDGGRTRHSGTFWTPKGPGQAKAQASDPVALDRLETFSREAVAPFLTRASHSRTAKERVGTVETGPL
jgi:NAD(P)-dependent dehydrogenase (short-subunit alcohol dehydrogenase family)